MVFSTLQVTALMYIPLLTSSAMLDELLASKENVRTVEDVCYIVKITADLVLLYPNITTGNIQVLSD